MFPSTPDPTRPAQRSVRSSVRHAVDLLVALVTLESYSVEDLWPSREAAPSASRASTPTSADAEPHRASSAPAAQHPHRDRLRAPDRARRPGRLAAPHHHCTTPVAASAARRRTPSTAAPVVVRD